VTEPGADRVDHLDELIPEHFRHLRTGGPVMEYLTGLAGRMAAATETAVAGDTTAQAEARDQLANFNVEYGLVRQFDAAYFERVGFYGHATALNQVSDELGGMLKHHASRNREALQGALEAIRTAFDAEGRAPNAGAPLPASD
jgi:hypothetical protein